MSRAHGPSRRELEAALPEYLRELDSELSAIRIEERPSFGPELEAELARAWEARQATPSSGPPSWARVLLAASLAGLMVAGFAVPSARASVWEVVRAILGESAPALLPAPEESSLPRIRVDRPTIPLSVGPFDVTLPPREVSEGSAAMDSGEPFTPVREVTFPRMLQAEETEKIIRSYYPLALQRAGIGGRVRLMFWVDSEGVPDNIQIRAGSGFPVLDSAAMRAARDLRFEPATRDRVPVGTWVEFVIRFVPDPETGMVPPDPVSSGESAVP